MGAASGKQDDPVHGPKGCNKVKMRPDRTWGLGMNFGGRPLGYLMNFPLLPLASGVPSFAAAPPPAAVREVQVAAVAGPAEAEEAARAVRDAGFWPVWRLPVRAIGLAGFQVLL